MLESSLKLDNDETVPKYELYDEKKENCLNITYSIGGSNSQIRTDDVFDFLIGNGYEDVKKTRIGNLEGLQGEKSNSKIVIVFFEESDYAYVIEYSNKMLFEYLKESFHFNQVDISGN